MSETGQDGRGKFVGGPGDVTPGTGSPRTAREQGTAARLRPRHLRKQMLAAAVAAALYPTGARAGTRARERRRAAITMLGAGVLLGWGVTMVLASMAPKELPRLDEVHLDTTVLLFAVGVSLITGLIFGVFPAWRASRLGATSLRGSLRSVLVIVEVALAFVLVVGTGLLGKSLLRLTAVDAGFDPHHILTLTPTATRRSRGRPRPVRPRTPCPNRPFRGAPTAA